MDFFMSLLLVGIFGGLVGFIFWYYNIKFNNKETLFGPWGGIGVGILGSAIGFFYLSPFINWLVINPLNINFVAAFFGALILLWVGIKVNPYNH